MGGSSKDSIIGKTVDDCNCISCADKPGPVDLTDVQQLTVLCMVLYWYTILRDWVKELNITYRFNEKSWLVCTQNV